MSSITTSLDRWQAPAQIGASSFNCATIAVRAYEEPVEFLETTWLLVSPISERQHLHLQGAVFPQVSSLPEDATVLYK